MAEILIVGGGVAGLSAGIHARLRGHQVVILEKNKHPGGNLTAWKRNGCTIDNCIHWLTGTNPASKIFRLWRTLGAFDEATEIIQKDSLFTVEADGKTVTLWRDLNRLTYDLSERFTEDRKQVARFLSAVKAMEYFGGVGGEDNQSGSKIGVLQGLPSLLYYYRRSAGQVAVEVKSPALKAFFTALTGPEFSSFGLICAAAAFCSGNGGIPKGGSYAMAVRMAKRFTGMGGVIQTGVEVSSVIGGPRPLVKFSNAERRSADYVIMATQPRECLGPAFPKGLQAQTAELGYNNFSALQAAYLCQAPSLPFSGILLLPMEGSDTGYIALREFSHDPDFAPQGQSILQAMLLCDEQTSLRWLAMKAQKKTYLSEKIALALRFANTIRARFPELTGKLQCLDVWTPASYQQWTGASMGGFMAHTLPPRKLPKALSPESPDTHILWATQWLQAPGGLPYAALAGKRAAQCLPAK